MFTNQGLSIIYTSYHLINLYHITYTTLKYFFGHCAQKRGLTGSKKSVLLSDNQQLNIYGFCFLFLLNLKARLLFSVDLENKKPTRKLSEEGVKIKSRFISNTCALKFSQQHQNDFRIYFSFHLFNVVNSQKKYFSWFQI